MLPLLKSDLAQRLMIVTGKKKMMNTMMITKTKMNMRNQSRNDRIALGPSKASPSIAHQMIVTSKFANYDSMAKHYKFYHGESYEFLKCGFDDHGNICDHRVKLHPMVENWEEKTRLHNNIEVSKEPREYYKTQLAARVEKQLNNALGPPPEKKWKMERVQCPANLEDGSNCRRACPRRDIPKHFKDKHGFPCPITGCAKDHGASKSLVNHLRKDHQIPEEDCESHVDESIKARKDHIKRLTKKVDGQIDEISPHHQLATKKKAAKKSVRNELNAKAPEKLYHCPQCEARLRLRTLKNQHCFVHHKIPCPVTSCKKSFSSASKWKPHMESCHEIVVDINDENNKGEAKNYYKDFYHKRDEITGPWYTKIDQLLETAVE